MKVLYPVCIIFVLKIDMPMDILFLVGGLLLILLGANGLTDGAASVAKRFHIPSIVIGLTIVAFGTSAPELTVSISSALKGSADIAIGNVVGSNTFNTLMIVGCTALFAPIAITRNTLKREIPLCILSSIALLICANDVFLDGSGESVGIIAQEERDREYGFLVRSHGEIGYLTYDYAASTALLGAALQEEDEKVEALKRRVKELENKLDRLKQSNHANR